MPLHTWIDPRRRLVAAHGTGFVADTDVFLYQTTIWTRPDVAGFDEVVDMGDVADIRVDSPTRTEDLARVASAMDSWYAGARLAVVAATEPVFALAQQYAQLRQQHGKGQKRVGVFRTRGEAEEWLGLPAGFLTKLFATPPTTTG